MIAQNAPHGPGPDVRRKEPVRRLGDAKAGRNRGPELLAVIAAKGRRRLIRNQAGAAGEDPGPRTVLRDENHAIMAVEITRPLGLCSAFKLVRRCNDDDRGLANFAREAGIRKRAIANGKVDALFDEIARAL
jgi:hypothetical protein